MPPRRPLNLRINPVFRHTLARLRDQEERLELLWEELTPICRQQIPSRGTD